MTNWESRVPRRGTWCVSVPFRPRPVHSPHPIVHLYDRPYLFACGEITYFSASANRPATAEELQKLHRCRECVAWQAQVVADILREGTR